MEKSKIGWEGSKLNFMVATDGSVAAHLGFEAVTDSLQHPSDKLTVVHIFNNKKEDVSFDMKPAALKQKYEQLTLVMGPHATLIWEQLNEGKSVKQQMAEAASSLNAGVLVVGLHGRKGPKEDHTILGSAV